MNLALNTIPGYSFFLPTAFGAARRLAARPRVIEASDSLQKLQKGGTLTIDHATSAKVICLEGSLWITHDGCSKDIFLDSGEHYIASSAARMLVHALKNSQLRLA